MKCINFLIIMTSSMALFSFSSDSRKPQVPVYSTSDSPVPVSRLEKDVFRLINEHRESIGLPPLEWVNSASVEASRHSNNMALRKTGFGHEGFEDRVSRLRGSIGNITAAAENVAYGKLTAEEVTEGWLHSPGHKKNIEGNYTMTGIGISTDSRGVLFFTQIFLR